MDDVKKYDPVLEQIEDARPALLKLVDPSMVDQVNQQLDDVVNRHRKVKTWANNRMKSVKEMEPLSETHEENALPVQDVTEDVTDELKRKPRTGIDLKKIAEEKKRIKVCTTFVFLFFLFCFFCMHVVNCRYFGNSMAYH